MISIRENRCDFCGACVTVCPVDCIEVTPKEEHTFSSPIPPVRVRYNECIGCSICARVCTKLTWDAIHMLPLQDFQAAFPEVEIFDKFIPSTVLSGSSDEDVIEI